MDTGRAVHPLIVELRNARVRQGMTQDQLAALIGTSQSAISDFENGVRLPTLRTFERIATILGYDLGLVPRPATRGDEPWKVT